MRPWLAEWAAATEQLSDLLDQAGKAKTRQAASRRRQEASKQLREFLERLAEFRVLDPACGSGNFLYLALHALKDLEHRIRVEAQTLGLQPPFPAVGPGQREGDRAQPVRGGTGARVGLDRRDPVDAASRVPRGPRPDSETVGHDRVQGCGADVGRWPGTGVAGGGRGDWESAVSGWEVAARACWVTAYVEGLQQAIRRTDSRGRRPGLPLVR